MRYIVIIQLIFISIHGFSQDSLPANNKLVIQFINDNYGEKVGSGICAELMYKTSEYIDSINGFRDSVMDDITVSNIMAGDIIEFDSVLCTDGHLRDKHIAVVYRVNPNGLLTIAQQNIGPVDQMIIYRGEEAPLVKDSHVAFDLFDLSTIVKGRVHFYRL